MQPCTYVALVIPSTSTSVCSCKRAFILVGAYTIRKERVYLYGEPLHSRDGAFIPNRLVEIVPPLSWNSTPPQKKTHTKRLIMTTILNRRLHSWLAHRQERPSSGRPWAFSRMRTSGSKLNCWKRRTKSHGPRWECICKCIHIHMCIHICMYTYVCVYRVNQIYKYIHMYIYFGLTLNPTAQRKGQGCKGQGESLYINAYTSIYVHTYTAFSRMRTSGSKPNCSNKRTRLQGPRWEYIYVCIHNYICIHTRERAGRSQTAQRNGQVCKGQVESSYIYMHTHPYVFNHLHICVYVYMHIYIYTYMYIHIYMFIYI